MSFNEFLAAAAIVLLPAALLYRFLLKPQSSRQKARAGWIGRELVELILVPAMVLIALAGFFIVTVLLDLVAPWAWLIGIAVILALAFSTLHMVRIAFFKK